VLLQAFSPDGFEIGNLMPSTSYDAVVCRPGAVIDDFRELTRECGYCRYCFRTGGSMPGLFYGRKIIS